MAGRRLFQAALPPDYNKGTDLLLVVDLRTCVAADGYGLINKYFAGLDGRWGMC